MNLMPLANRLEALHLGTKGETIFIHMLPAEAEQGVLLRSPLTGTPINYELPGYYKSEFQVIVRTPAARYAEGAALMDAVCAALTLDNADVESLHINYCRPRTQPVTFPLSAGNLIELSARFDICFVQG